MTFANATDLYTLKKERIDRQISRQPDHESISKDICPVQWNSSVRR